MDLINHADLADLVQKMETEMALAPAEIVATERNETKPGFSHLKFNGARQLQSRQQRLTVHITQIPLLSARTGVEAARTRIESDDDLLLSGYVLIAEIEADGLVGIAANGVAPERQWHGHAAARPADDD
jgi:hypothetical protein